MAKGSYVGVGGQIVKGDIIPKTWAGSKSPYTSNGIVLTASGEYSGYPATYACNGDTTNFYRDSGVTESWLKLTFPTPQKITKMKTWITALSGTYFSNALIQGSNDDNNWNNLYNITSAQTALTAITLNNPDYYKYYRIYAISTDSSRPPIIYEWQVAEYIQNPVARKVKKAYAVVDDIERKVIKGYVGVNGIARQFYPSVQLVPFTSSPIPTEWTVGSSNLRATANNDYGNWTVVASVGSDKEIYSPMVLFDSETSGNYYTTQDLTSDSTSATVRLYCPTNASIKPTKITIRHCYAGNSSYPAKVQGLLNGSWVDIATLTHSSYAKTETFNISGTDYYTSFRLLLYRYSSGYKACWVYEFQITAGTLKIE